MRLIKKVITVVVFFLATNFVTGQVLEVDNSITPEEFVEMLVGSGVEVSNITFSGDPTQFGSFNQNGANIDMDSGLIMGTGDVDLAIGPDLEDGASLGDFFGAGDADLELLSGINTNDAAILEFDFVATGDFLSFEYTFASEEYIDYVCGGVNDAFGFFLSGPGINGVYSSPAGFPDGSTNIALIPGTEIGVSINTVNNGVPSFGDPTPCSDLDPNWTDNVIYFIDNEGGTSIEYDGFTVVLTAESNVQCGETYHIKLAIADGGDTVFDSGVFLEANSFVAQYTAITSNPTTEGSFYYDNDTILVEGCNIGSFLFTRGDTLNIDTIFFNVEGTTEVGDLTVPLPDFVIFEPGEDSLEVFIQALADTLTEGLEELTLNYSYIHLCTGDTISTSSTIWLQDQVPPSIQEENHNMYCTDILLDPVILQGDGPFIWTWGIVGDTNVVNGPWTYPVSYDEGYEETTYWVTIEDPCFSKDSLAITVTPLPIPPLVITGDAVDVDCPGDEAVLIANIPSGAEPFSIIWSNLANQDTISVFPDESEVLTVYVTDFCGQEDSLDIQVNVALPDGPLFSSVPAADTPCPGLPANLVSTTTGGYNSNGYTYLWENGVTENSITVSPLVFSNYTVTVTDGCGNTVDALGIVNVLIPVEITMTTDEDLCIGNGFYAPVAIEGGEEPFEITTNEYLNFNTVTHEISGVIPGIGTVLTTDQCGQTATVDILINACDTYIPNIFTPGNSIGFNDTFVILGIDAFPMSSLKIFNRWGNIVYESLDYKNDWKAEDVAGGTYYYIFERSDEENYSGYIEILK